MKELTAFELQRLENIRKNQELMISLGIGEEDARIGSPPPTPPPSKPGKPRAKRRRDSSIPEPQAPTRKSSRSSNPNTSYREIGQDGNPIFHRSQNWGVKKEKVIRPPREGSRRSKRGASNSDDDIFEGNGERRVSNRSNNETSSSKYQDWDTEDEDDVQFDENGYKILGTPKSKPGLKRLKNPSPLANKRTKYQDSPATTVSTQDNSESEEEGELGKGSAKVSSIKAPLPGRDEASKALLFEEGYEHFKPNLTPKEMIRGGMQGGTAFKAHESSVTRKILDPEDMAEFPSEWFEDLDLDSKVTSDTYDPKQNRFKVKAGQTLKDWEEAGWINSSDPRGWWQWYFKFYQGRRSSDDDRQISRWLKACGPAGRFKRSLVQELHRLDKRWDDETIKPVVRQTLWHWGYELTEPDWMAYQP